MAAKTTVARTEKKTTTKRPSRRPTSTRANGTTEEMQQASSFEPTREQIAQRAFELYLARGGEHGRHEEDWHRAEQEIRENLS